MSELRHFVNQEQGATRLTLEGEIDITNARALRVLLLQTLQQSQSLSLDLAAVASMDSSGIATLIEARAKSIAIGRSFRVVAVSERVRLALKLLCIDQMLMGG